MEHCGFNGGVFVAIGSVVGEILPTKKFDCLGEPFVPTATIGITPDLRVVELGDCRTPFCHIEKGILKKSWVKSDLWFLRYCNFSGEGPSLQLPYPVLRIE